MASSNVLACHLFRHRWRDHTSLHYPRHKTSYPTLSHFSSKLTDRFITLFSQPLQAPLQTTEAFASWRRDRDLRALKNFTSRAKDDDSWLDVGLALVSVCRSFECQRGSVGAVDGGEGGDELEKALFSAWADWTKHSAKRFDDVPITSSRARDAMGFNVEGSSSGDEEAATKETMTVRFQSRQGEFRLLRPRAAQSRDFSRLHYVLSDLDGAARAQNAVYNGILRKKWRRLWDTPNSRKLGMHSLRAWATQDRETREKEVKARGRKQRNEATAEWDRWAKRKERSQIDLTAVTPLKKVSLSYLLSLFPFSMLRS